MYIDSDMCSCPSKMYIIVGLLKLTCGKYFDGINCELFTTGKFSLKWADTALGLHCVRLQCTAVNSVNISKQQLHPNQIDPSSVISSGENLFKSSCRANTIN